MRYDKASGELQLTVRDAVAFSIFHYMGTASGEGQLPCRRATDGVRRELGFPLPPVPLSGTLRAGEHTVRLLGSADALTKEGRTPVLTLVLLTDGDPTLPSPEVLRAARAEAYLLAALTEGAAPRLRTVYHNAELGTTAVREESPRRARLLEFRDRVAASLLLYAAEELVRVRERLPKMRAMRFPYGERRLGQDELMSAVYRTCSRGGRLYATAPTGIGKTVSTLYPAVRAMGEGKCDKVFYLTAKATAARAAAQEAALLGADGGLRTLLLASKERLCPRRGAPCREGLACGNAKGGVHEDAALSELLSLGLPLVTPDAVSEVAARHGVCPHELSLHYSMLSDVIICDYNYLFDPAVRLSRYFSSGGRWCFLIDEAHNLPDRVRDICARGTGSAALSALSLPKDDPECTFTVRAAEQARDALLSLLASLAPEGEGERLLTRLPDELPLAVHTLAVPLGVLMRRRSIPQEMRRQIRAFYYDLKRILDISAWYDGGFRLRVRRNDEGLSFSFLCLDPAGVVRRALDDGRSAVLFSATLSPIEYYRDLLGGEGEDVLLELSSPFPRENLAVAILDKVSLRYPDREQTLSEVVGAVLTTARARRGNYMVFCPSFSYAEQLAAALSPYAAEFRLLVSGRTMSPARRAAFLAEFEREGAPVLAISVLGGIFGESVDLAGRRLVGAVIIGVGLASPDPDREELAAYFREKNDCGHEYAYLYPGMNRVLQAAGRVIRTDEDVGVVVLVDERFATPPYRRILPPHWRGLTLAGNNRSLAELLRRFWEGHPEEEGEPS